MNWPIWLLTVANSNSLSGRRACALKNSMTPSASFRVIRQTPCAEPGSRFHGQKGLPRITRININNSVEFVKFVASTFRRQAFLHTLGSHLSGARELKAPATRATLTRCAGHTCFLAAFARPCCGAAPNTRPAKSATVTSPTSAEFVSVTPGAPQKRDTSLRR